MLYQLTSSKEIVGRIDNNFDVDYSDWVGRAPLWIADALDQLQMVSSYEEVYIDLEVENYIVNLPDHVPQDIRRIQGVEYDGVLLRRLNVLNPIKQPNVNCEYSSEYTYSIKNGYIVCSFEEGTIRLYYQTPAIEFEVETQIYWPKVPINSIIQGAIEWYIIYSILKRGHKHPTFSLDSKNPITNPYAMWEQEAKKARNQGSPMDIEDRAEMSRLLRTFAVDTTRYLTNDFREEDRDELVDGITGYEGI